MCIQEIAAAHSVGLGRPSGARFRSYPMFIRKPYHPANCWMYRLRSSGFSFTPNDHDNSAILEQAGLLESRKRGTTGIEASPAAMLAKMNEQIARNTYMETGLGRSRYQANIVDTYHTAFRKPEVSNAHQV